jgi:organic hydroperoxide reductase OsmC/OhrA
MSLHTAEVHWERHDAVFTDKRYSRAHRWSFDGGVVVPASSSPHAVPLPYSEPANVDPEEAYVAALSSCHMLTFLWLAARQGFVVDSYTDAAEGTMEVNDAGKEAVTRVTLRPRIVFAGARQPTEAELDALHHQAHEECYLANSVKTAIEVRAR